jgi:uncharacterized membrane protein
MHYLTTLMLMLGLLATPTMAQDTPPPAPTEEVAPADDAGAVPVADAPAVEGGDVVAPATEEPKEGDQAAPEAAEGDEAAPEAPKAPETDEEAVEAVLSLVAALKAGQWPLAIGLLLSLLVYGVNRFALKEKLDGKVVPWVSFGVGVAGATGTGLVLGTSLFEAFTAGILAGVAAIGGWEMLLKHIKAPKAESEAPKAEEPVKEEPKS